MLKNIFYFIVKMVAKVTFSIYFRIGIKDMENIPESGSIVVASNHNSHLDPPVLGSVFPRRVQFLIAGHIYEKWFLNWFYRMLRSLPVKSGQNIASLKMAINALNAGGVIGIFPEGGRSRSGKIEEPEPGIGLLVLKSGATVVPSAIIGTREAMPPGAIFPKPHKVMVVFGKPIHYEMKKTKIHREDLESIKSEVKNAIVELLKENGREDYINGKNL